MNKHCRYERPLKHIILAMSICAHSNLLFRNIHIQIHLSYIIYVHHTTQLHTYTYVPKPQVKQKHIGISKQETNKTLYAFNGIHIFQVPIQKYTNTYTSSMKFLINHIIINIIINYAMHIYFHHFMCFIHFIFYFHLFY